MKSPAPPAFVADMPHVWLRRAADGSASSVTSAIPAAASPAGAQDRIAQDGDATLVRSAETSGLPSGRVEATVIRGNAATSLAAASPPGGEQSPPSGRSHTPVAEVGRALEGRRLGVYELQKFVGGGGMGAVFRGRDTTLDRTVAVKVLFQHRTDDADLLRRFKNEAQSAARLDHENIGRVYAVGSEGGWHYIVFEFIEGTNLRDLVHANGPFDIARTMTVTSQIADALAHAEARNVVHRDIKPSNVIITPSGRARLVDMGLARLHQMSGDRDLTVSGMTLGTFDYISPEQARDPRLADVRSDLYSLGCTTYFMLIGRPPFADGTMVQKLLQHQQEPPVPVDRLRPDVPRGLAQVISRLMEKDPDDRYQHPAELVAALADVAADRGIELPLPTTTLVPRQRRRPWRLVDHLPWMIPLLGFAAVVAGLWLSSREGRSGGERPLRSTSPVATTGTSQGGASQRAGGRHRVVDAPDADAEGWTEHVSLAEAVAAAADGDLIELAFDDQRDELPISVVGKRLTIVAAEGFRPAIRFSGVGTESASRERAGLLLDEGSLEIRDLTISLAAASETREQPARLFLVRSGSRLTVAGCRIAVEGIGTAAESSRARCIEVMPSLAAQDAAPPGVAAEPRSEANGGVDGPESGRESRLELIDTVVRGAMNFLQVSGTGRVDLSWSGGSLVAAGRGAIVEGAVRDAEQGMLVTMTLEQGLFACREGFACLLDSPARPTEPQLDVATSECRFLIPEGVPLIEQSGIEDPEIYRGRVRWVDAGSRYEGSSVFRRIDGAAERMEIEFASLDQPLQYQPQIATWPEEGPFEAESADRSPATTTARDGGGNTSGAEAEAGVAEEQPVPSEE
jgi:serine/threonine protein kinase